MSDELKATPIYVLVADKEPSTREVFSAVVKEVCPNAKIVEAHDANSVAFKVKNHRMDIVLMSVSMAGSGDTALLNSIAKMEMDIKPHVMLLVTDTPAEKRWKDLFPRLVCIQRPFDDAQLRDHILLARLSFF
jgi:CheY-like chemotaxis protein